MRFLVDECTGPSVAKWLRGEGHEVFSVFDEAQGIDDDMILTRALAEGVSIAAWSFLDWTTNVRPIRSTC